MSRFGFAVQVASAPRGRNYLASASAQRFTAAGALQAPTYDNGPVAFCMALPAQAIAIGRHGDREAGDRCSLASNGVPPALAVEVAARGGRPKVPVELRSLIRRMSVENQLWGAPRIHGELLKLGYEVAESTVAKYMVKRRPGSSQTWKTFLHNHAAGIVAMDFLVVPTVGFRLLFVLVILRHQRRRLISLSVTTNPTAEWIAQQITEAFT
jgi:hypothetical protein